MGNHRHVLGNIEGERVDLRLPDTAPPPSPGARLQVIARRFVPLS
jgi:hypothetical protein